MSAGVETPHIGVMPIGAATTIGTRRPPRAVADVLVAACRWIHARTRAVVAGRASRRLNVTETVSLGEKRFVSILCVDGEQFLLGGSSSNVVLLAKLEKSVTARCSQMGPCEPFGDLLSDLRGGAARNVNSDLGDQRV